MALVKTNEGRGGSPFPEEEDEAQGSRHKLGEESQPWLAVALLFSRHAAGQGHLNVTGLSPFTSARKLAAPPFLHLQSPGDRRAAFGDRTSGQIMPCATELVHGEGGTIKVGTTGTIGSLMTRELDSIKVAPQAAVGTPRLRRQGCPVSVPCGATTPRKLMMRKSSSDISSSRTDRASAEEACKPKRVSRRNTFDSPMLQSDSALVDRTTNAGKAKKKGSVYGVEVVDVKCGNPMSSRLRKLGFSKLSETFA